MKKASIKKTIKIIWFSFVAVFTIWNITTYQSRNLPDDTFLSNKKVSVTENDDMITFQAKDSNDKLHVIFFQGALADPKSYGPLCRKLAEHGFTTHLIKMKWRLANGDYQKITKLFNFQKGNYVLGGHSQGGKMASHYVYENPGKLKGLFMLGTSHPRDVDLSGQSIPSIKIYSSNDGLASVGEVLENKNKLPASAQFYLIEGGNHSQFGYLGKLFMDDAADISLGEQQQQTLDQLVAFLNGIKPMD